MDLEKIFELENVDTCSIGYTNCEGEFKTIESFKENVQTELDFIFDVLQINECQLIVGSKILSLKLNNR